MRSVSPGRVEGRVKVPHSKSVFQRAVAASTLALGTSIIYVDHLCDDDLAALNVAQILGAHVSRLDDRVEITGPARPVGGEINCGESGLSFRMFSAVASLFDKEFKMIAEGSLNARPMDMVIEPLKSLGVDCRAEDSLPPLTIRGPMRAGKVVVDGSKSSQFVTGLMIALPRCVKHSEILAPGLASKPYVELTIRILEYFGVYVNADENLAHFDVPGSQNYRPTIMVIEGDWSAAAFLLVAGGIAGDVTITGLDLNSLQPDRRALDALRDTLAHVRTGPGEIAIRSERPDSFHVDATDSPDLFPPLVALALNCRGVSTIAGVSRLRHKESDRAAALMEEFGKLGGDIKIHGNVMKITGSKLEGGRVKSHGDHRIAMSLAVAALTAAGPVEIEGDECVNKSYPTFFDDLESMGARVT